MLIIAAFALPARGAALLTAFQASEDDVFIVLVAAVALCGVNFNFDECVMDVCAWRRHCAVAPEEKGSARFRGD